MTVIHEFSRAWASLMWDISWQSALLFVLIGIVVLVVPRTSSAFRYGLWMIVLIRLCIPYSFTLPTGMSQHIQAPVEQAALTLVPAFVVSLEPSAYANTVSAHSVTETQPGAISEFHWNIPAATLWILAWLFGAFILGAWVVVKAFRAHRALSKAPLVQDAQFVEWLNRLRQDLGIRQTVSLHQINDEATCSSPMVYGLFRPAIYMPASLLHPEAKEKIEPILLHELAHIRRRDPLVNALQIMVQIVFFFHPLVWWLNHILRHLREEICDDIAVSHLHGEVSQYSRCMVNVLEQSQWQAAPRWGTMGLLENNGIQSRIRRLLDGRYRVYAGMKWWAVVGVCVVAFLTLSLSANKTESLVKELVVTVLNENNEPVVGATIEILSLRPINNIGSFYYAPHNDGAKPATNNEGNMIVKYPLYTYEEVETGKLRIQVKHPDYAQMIVDDFSIDGSSNPVILLIGAELLPTAQLNDQSLESFNINIGPREFVIQQGQPSIKHIYPGDYNIYATHEENGTIFYSEVKALSVTNKQQYSLLFEMYPGISLQGELDSRVPRPVKKGKVKVSWINQFMSIFSQEKVLLTHRPFNAEVNEDGTFLIHNLPKGYCEIIAICDRYISKEVPDEDPYRNNQNFKLQENMQKISVQMEPSATLKGKIINQNNALVSGAKVQLFPNVHWGNGSSQIFMNMDFSDTTEADGYFEIKNLPGKERLSCSIAADKYELPPFRGSNDLFSRRIYQVDLKPGEEKEINIQVVPKGTMPIKSTDEGKGESKTSYQSEIGENEDER